MTYFPRSGERFGVFTRLRSKDAWNLRCRSMGSRAKLVVHPGDRILSVNGESDNVQARCRTHAGHTWDT